jgi:serine/threonine-protein kinase
MSDSISTLTEALADRYRVEREIGHGGMATVYLAEDLKHARRVALKVLHPDLAAALGAERFLSEIRTTANLQHPHILALHDSGAANGFLYYVMPYVEGESLRARLEREKQLPIDDAVRIASELAGALGYAHARGVIHRDIKPENILLQGGHALVADFGIALAVQTAGGQRLTQTGLSLGTPHYMSPEQAMGERAIDARSDIYALGAVTYEMVTGDPPFTGATVQAIMAKVMTERPTPPSAVRDTIPEAVEDAVLKALAKLPADRFSTAAEFATALALAPPRSGARRLTTHQVGEAGVPARAARVWPAVAAIAAIAALWGWLRPRPPAAEMPPSRLAVPIPMLGGASTSLQRQIALTPDGTALFYTAITSDGENRTFRQALADTAPVVVPDVVPFLADYVISPDGRELVGSFGGVRMYRYSVAGGNGQPIPPEINPTSNVVWTPDGALWFSATSDIGRGIARLDVTGKVTRPFGTKHVDLLLQHVLPDGHSVLAIRQPQGSGGGPAVLLDLRTKEARVLIDRPIVDIHYTLGYLVMVSQGGALEAVPFDANGLRVTGEAIHLADGISTPGFGVAQLAVAQNGTIAYVPAEARSLFLVDRQGNGRPATLERRNYHAPNFSPDGRRIATDFASDDGRDVWTLDLTDGRLTRMTFERDGHDPTWSPDGASLTFLSSHGGTLGLFRTHPGRPDAPDTLLISDQLGWTGTWLRDRSGLVTAASALRPESRGDIGLITNGGRGPIEPLVATRFEEQHPAVSPDGRWLAFTSDQSRRNEVYVRPLRGEGEQVQVSVDGGVEPVWSPDSRELFYRGGAGSKAMMTAATVSTSPRLAITSRKGLFPVAEYSMATPHSNYAVSPDGKTFALVGFNQAARVVIIQNLPGLVRRLTAGEREGKP